MRKKFDKLIAIYGYKELFFISLYPIFLPLFMLKDTSLSVYNIIKSLLKYEWKYLSGNDQANSYNNLFYYTQDFNIQKFGRYGVSDLLAGGNFSLKNWFHTTPFSLRMQSSFGTTFIMFFAMCFWLLSWVILYQDNSNLWLVLGIIFFSTMFFATFIEIQNYNILGYMLFPIFLTYLTSGNYLLLATILFLISLSSFTAFLIAGILVLVSSIYNSDYYLLLTLIAGGIKWIIPIIISMKDEALNKMLGALGGHEKVKYSRVEVKKLTVGKLYLILLLSQFILCYILLYGFDINILLLLTVLFLHIVNELISRFADQQSFYILFSTLSTFLILSINEYTNLILISFFLVNYPIYFLLGNVRALGKSTLRPFSRKPFNSMSTIVNLQELFNNVPKNSKLLIAYKNPQGEYNNIFNGYRIFNEPIHYVAALNDISLLPDWYIVFENNKENDDDTFWIDTEEEAQYYMHENKILYIIVPSFYEQKWEKYFDFIDDFNFNINEKEIIVNKNKLELNLYKLKEDI